GVPSSRIGGAWCNNKKSEMPPTREIWDFGGFSPSTPCPHTTPTLGGGFRRAGGGDGASTPPGGKPGEGTPPRGGVRVGPPTPKGRTTPLAPARPGRRRPIQRCRCCSLHERGCIAVCRCIAAQVYPCEKKA